MGTKNNPFDRWNFDPETKSFIYFCSFCKNTETIQPQGSSYNDYLKKLNEGLDDNYKHVCKKSDNKD